MVCNFQNGSWGHETTDAQTFASWGVDFVKNDYCYTAGDSFEAGAANAFRKMRDALDATGRRMVYAIHGKQTQFWPTYYTDSPLIANSWRMGGDIEGPMKPSWAGVLRLIDSEAGSNITELSSPNAWNDCDMMVCGQGLTDTEDRAHISMWAMLASPMIIGYDIRKKSNITIAFLSHPGIVAISQDPLGRQATLVERVESAPAPANNTEAGHEEAIHGRAPPKTSPSPPTSWCLGEVGDSGRPVKVVPCDDTTGAASRWSYNSATAQLVLTSGALAGSCLALPTLSSPTGGGDKPTALALTSCASGGHGWVFSDELGFTGLLHASVAKQNEMGCVNLWQCDPHSEVVYWPCKPAHVGTCGSVNEVWRLRPDGMLQSSVVGVAPPLPPPPPPPAEATQVWRRPLSHPPGAVAVCLLNRGSTVANISFTFAEVGLGSTQRADVRDVWAGSSVTATAGSYGAVVAGHAAEVFVLTRRS
jgi:hypothetical protein